MLEKYSHCVGETSRYITLEEYVEEVFTYTGMYFLIIKYTFKAYITHCNAIRLGEGNLRFKTLVDLAR